MLQLTGFTFWVNVSFWGCSRVYMLWNNKTGSQTGTLWSIFLGSRCVSCRGSDCRSESSRRWCDATVERKRKQEGSAGGLLISVVMSERYRCDLVIWEWKSLEWHVVLLLCVFFHMDVQLQASVVWSGTRWRTKVEVKEFNVPPAPLKLILMNIFMKLSSMKSSRHSVPSLLCSVFLIQLWGRSTFHSRV